MNKRLETLDDLGPDIKGQAYLALLPDHMHNHLMEMCTFMHQEFSAKFSGPEPPKTSPNDLLPPQLTCPDYYLHVRTCRRRSRCLSRPSSLHGDRKPTEN